MKPYQTHCRHCGEEMFDFLAEAENVKVHSYATMGSRHGEQLGSRFNKKGERNYATVWQCPNYGSQPWYKKMLVDQHDIFVDYDRKIHYPSNL